MEKDTRRLVGGGEKLSVGGMRWETGKSGGEAYDSSPNLRVRTTSS